MFPVNEPYFKAGELLLLPWQVACVFSIGSRFFSAQGEQKDPCKNVHEVSL